MFDEIESIIGETKEDFLQKLTSMYFKNSSILKLIEVLNLNWACHPLDEFMSTAEIIEYLKQQKQTNMKTPENKNEKNQSTNSPKERFKNEAPDMAGFLEFNIPGQIIVGKLVGSKLITFNKDGQKQTTKHYIIVDEDDSVEWLLPANVELTNKLDFAAQTLGGALSHQNFKEVQIEFKEQIPHPSDPIRTIKKFSVKY